MSENISRLEAACDQHVGRTLIIEPHHGHGWYHTPGGPFGDHGVPTPFHVRVERVYTYKEARRGVLARVTEPGFAYDGFWLVSMTRHIGVWNFTDWPATYNLLLCPEEPVEGKEEDSPEYGKLWPVWHLRGQPQASGFGRIAESLECCAESDEGHPMLSPKALKQRLVHVFDEFSAGTSNTNAFDRLPLTARIEMSQYPTDVDEIAMIGTYLSSTSWSLVTSARLLINSSDGFVELAWSDIAKCRPSDLAERRTDVDIKTQATRFEIICLDGRHYSLETEPGSAFMGLWNVLMRMTRRPKTDSAR